MLLAPLSQRSITFRWLSVSPEKKGRKRSDSDTHEASAAKRGFSTQRSTAGLGLGPAKRNYFLARRQVSLSRVGFFFRRRTLRETDFSLPAKHLPSGADVWYAASKEQMLQFRTSSVGQRSYLLSALVLLRGQSRCSLMFLAGMRRSVRRNRWPTPLF